MLCVHTGAVKVRAEYKDFLELVEKNENMVS